MWKKCENHNIREEYLKESVLVSIQARIRSVIDLENLVRYVDALPFTAAGDHQAPGPARPKAGGSRAVQEAFRSLYERLSEGILTQNEFLEFKAVYAHRCDEAERAAGALQREIKAATAGTSGTFRWIEDFREHRNLTKLTRKVVVMLIKQIKVYKDQRIHIQFYQENECRCLAERIMSAADGQPAADYRKGIRMARTSRKQIHQQTDLAQAPKTYLGGAYRRLSVEDDRHRDRHSLENQENIILDFLKHILISVLWRSTPITERPEPSLTGRIFKG